MTPVYFDNSATTPLSEGAKQAMISAMECYGNPSSLHSMGVDAERIITEARKVILTTLGVRSVTKINEKQLIFTASGTEADNLAILGTFAAKDHGVGKKLIISDSEHSAVLETARELERRGVTVVRVPTVNGVPDHGMIEREADKNTVMASFMAVNNETGALYDIKRISRIIKAANPDAIMHTDCVQAYMKLPISQRSLGADMISISAHKIGGPKGVGALFVSADMLKKRQLAPIVFGGGQESGMRSGTENVIGIAGFSGAVKEAGACMQANIEKCRNLRNKLIFALQNDVRFTGVKLNLPEAHAEHILSITLPSIKSETMLHRLSMDGIYVSSGSACSSNTGHRSHVLRAFGLSEHDADCTIRVSLGVGSTDAEAERFLDALASGIATLVRI